MGERPDVQAHHQHRRAALQGQGGAHRLDRRAQHREGAIRGLRQLGVGIRRNAALEHRREIRRLVAREGEMRPPDVLEGGKRRGAAAVPGFFELGAEALESLPRHVGDEPLPVAVMPIGRGRTHAGGARGFREGEAGQAALGDQVERCPDQRLAQIAVMIAAPARRRPVSRPNHVRISYMNRSAEGRAGRSFPKPRWRAYGHRPNAPP